MGSAREAKGIILPSFRSYSTFVLVLITLFDLFRSTGGGGVGADFPADLIRSSIQIEYDLAHENYYT